jgi:hypothetical protein
MVTILDPFPRVRLASLPTSLEPLPRLSEYLGGPRVLVKRDDQTGLALGGNKVRKLEYLAGHALEIGCDTLVTIGGLQSNHARQTAAAAARLGLQCELVLPRVVPRSGEEYEQSGNVLLDRLLGARLRVLPAGQNPSGVLEGEDSLDILLGGQPPAPGTGRGRGRWKSDGGAHGAPAGCACTFASRASSTRRAAWGMTVPGPKMATAPSLYSSS